MAFCSKCGEEIEFRYIDGRPTPIHQGGWCAGADAPDSRFRPSLHVSRESECRPTKCPRCAESVYFIRHNGGSVWIEEPLGPPWWKHRCMHPMATTKQGSLLKPIKGSFDRLSMIQAGVVVAAEVCSRRLSMLIELRTPNSESVVLFCNFDGEMPLGRLAFIDLATFRFRLQGNQTRIDILSVIRNHRAFSKGAHITCPSCGGNFSTNRLRQHLMDAHKFTKAY
jgi:uncharacterized protein (DUF983 family)